MYIQVRHTRHNRTVCQSAHIVQFYLYLEKRYFKQDCQMTCEILPFVTWDNAKHFITYSVRKKVPHDVAFHHMATKTLHLCPFGSKALFRSVSDKLSTFALRLVEGIWLEHTGGRVYKILTDDWIIRTKHVKFIKNIFSHNGSQKESISIAESNSADGYEYDSSYDSNINQDETHSIYENVCEHDKKQNNDFETTPPEEAKHFGSEHESSSLTYYPKLTSTYGQSDHDDNEFLDDDEFLVDGKETTSSAHDPGSDSVDENVAQ